MHVQEHLGDVPEYLVPAALKPMVDIMNAKRKKKMSEKYAAAKKRAKSDNPLLVNGIDYMKKG